MEEVKTTKQHRGFHRWLVLLCIILGVFGAMFFPPVRPHIQVAAEALGEHPLFVIPGITEFYLTNTLVATLIGDLILIALALAVKNATDGGKLITRGIVSLVEMLIETLYNLTESTAGKHAKMIFPWFATIFLVVIIANYIDLIPGVDSIGLLHKAEGHGSPAHFISDGVAYIYPADEAHAAEGSHEVTYGVIPFVRAASTDLNFTAALALISVFMTQVVGVRAQGLRYFTKFFNYLNLFKKPFFGAMDFLVGLLELISELAKILSFSFRLFGVIFAGMVLLFLVGSMVPVFMQSFILLFEVFMGAIQAVVFGMLTMIFMAQATHGHGDEEHEAH